MQARSSVVVILSLALGGLMGWAQDTQSTDLSKATLNLGGSAPATNPQNESGMAISGTVLLKSSAFPVGMAGVRLGLFGVLQGEWKQIDELSSDRGGEFHFTRHLASGTFEIRCMDKRYTGSVKVALEEKPLKNLVFEVEKK